MEDEEFETLLSMYKLTGQISAQLNIMCIDYSRILTGFEKLEKLVEPLPVFHIPDYIPEEHRHEILKYRLKENLPLGHIGDMIGGFLLASTEKMIEIYLKYFELIFENIIVPIIVRKAPPPPRGQWRHSYNYQINWTRNYLAENDLADSVGLFLDTLDGDLRNAFVHKNYYVKDENLVYYTEKPRERISEFHEKQVKEFKEKAHLTIFQRYVFYLLCGLRLTGRPMEELQKPQNGELSG
ncbi:MAG: hypothetical protein ACFFDT_38100 [Candidatus Hodarchaeota archaeon]